MLNCALLQAAAPSDGRINTCSASSVCSDSPFKHHRITRRVQLALYEVKISTIKAHTSSRLKNLCRFYSLRQFPQTETSLAWASGLRSDLVHTLKAQTGPADPDRITLMNQCIKRQPPFSNSSKCLSVKQNISAPLQADPPSKHHYSSSQMKWTNIYTDLTDKQLRKPKDFIKWLTPTK